MSHMSPSFLFSSSPQRARRSASKKTFLRSKRKREWRESTLVTSTSTTPSQGKDTQSITEVSNESSSKRPAVEKRQSMLASNNDGNDDDDTTLQSQNAIETNAANLKHPPPSSLKGTESTAQSASKAATASATSLAASSSNKKSAKKNNSPAIFSALQRPITGQETVDSLDWYAYHRGRAGLENRDEQTGEWQYDVPMATDTNHNVDEPTWSTAKFSLRFPLDDWSRRNGDGKADGRKSFFREMFFWDWIGGNNIVVDGEMQESGESQAQYGLLEKTPMEIAGSIAVEYGLTFPETIDLAEYIQSQLRSWVQQEASYSPPLTLIDPMTGQRREKPSSSIIELYGNVIGMGEGGLEDKPGPGAPQRSFPIPRRLSSMDSSKKQSKPKSAGPKKETRKSIIKPDEKCMDEVRRRLLAASTEEIKGKTPDGAQPGVLQIQKGLSCHLCELKDGVFAQFACEQDGHCFCRDHIRIKCGLPLDGDPIALAHCPICTLLCNCDSCTATLEKLAVLFKTKNIEQDCPIQDTAFDDLLFKARMKRAEGPKKGKARGKRKSAFLVEKMVVSKIPGTDLPREVSEGIDIDPGTDADYAATYTEKGPIFPPGLSFSIEPAKADLATKTSFTLEDGSVDFCNVCRGHGSLLCCDFCPRAFHAKCLPTSKADEQSNSPWECPSCCAEKAGLKEDKVDGEKSLNEVSAVYGGEEGQSAQGNMLLLLATIHQMVLRLMAYDFGYIFSEPVNTEQFPEYPNIVKKPMDLGTVSKKLLDGSYKESGEISLEDIAIKVLQDIDLVWKNCYLFNVEGSSVYRMALVQERRAKAIREVSFHDLLTEKIKVTLGYKNDSNIDAGSKESSVSAGFEGIVRPQKSRHKITVSKRHHNGRPVAVLDPDTRKVVKIYSTMQAAGAAVIFLLGLGHRCEWQGIEVDTLQKVRRVVKDAHAKPAYTLFGYRWLMLDSLRSGDISFPKNDPTRTTKERPSGKEKGRANSKIRKMSKEGRVLKEFHTIDQAYRDYAASSQTNPNDCVDQAKFESDFLNGNKLCGEHVYSLESPVLTPSIKSDSMDTANACTNDVAGNHIELSTPNDVSCAETSSRLSPSTNPEESKLGSDVLGSEKDEGKEAGSTTVYSMEETVKDKMSVDQNTTSNTEINSDCEAMLASKQEVPILTNGSKAKQID